MKEQLLKTATGLKSPSQMAIDEFTLNQERLAELGNGIMASRIDFQKLAGADNLQMAKDNNRNFARFMASLFTEYDPNVFMETVLWVFRAYRSHGFQTTYWPANLNIWVDLIKSELSEETYASIYPFYNWLIVNIPLFVKITDEDYAGFSADDIPNH